MCSLSLPSSPVPHAVRQTQEVVGASGVSGLPAVRAAMVAAGPESGNAKEAQTVREATLTKSSATPSPVLVSVVSTLYCSPGLVLLAHTWLICSAIQPLLDTVRLYYSTSVSCLSALCLCTMPPT